MKAIRKKDGCYYVTRRVCKGCDRDWFMVKFDSKGRQGVIPILSIKTPPEIIGKKFKLKLIEVKRK